MSCFWLVACERHDVQTYQIPKEIVAAPATPPKDIAWKVPDGWQEQKPSSMRIGSFLATSPNGQQADISVIPLEGDAGGDLSNINRWRGQINLGPLREPDLSPQSQSISPAGRTMRLIDFVNQNKRLIAAIYHARGRTWFFKMTGDHEAVQAARPAFMAFLGSLRFPAETLRD